MPQTLTQIKTSLSAFGLRPKHRLGQNFLHDHNKLRAVVQAADIQPGQTVLEVGAGTGTLSELLLEAGANLVAVEVDRDLEALLQQRLSVYSPRATLLIADALAGKHQLNPLVTQAVRGMINNATEHTPHTPPSFKLVANLPYNIASPLLANLATQGADGVAMSDAVVMVQREVADRLCAAPGGKAYGPLGILLQAICHVETVATVSAECFWPKPKVGSAVVRLKRRTPPMTDNTDALRHTLQRLFSQRRKKISTTLGRDQKLPEGVDPSDRPQRLSVEQLVAISRCLKQA